MIHLTAFPAGQNGTVWYVSQDGAEIGFTLNDEDGARHGADLCAHRASLLRVLAARPARFDSAALDAFVRKRWLRSPTWCAFETWAMRACDLKLCSNGRPLCTTHDVVVAFPEAMCHVHADALDDRDEELERLGGMWGWIGECAHPVTVEVTPCVGGAARQAALICKCCGSFRRRVGPGWGWWGDWELSAPDVEAVRFPWPANRNVGETVGYPEGAAFFIHEVAP